MSKSRSRGKVRPCYYPVAPLPGTRGYLRVVSRGCATSKDYFGDGSCEKGYGWDCGDCPMVRENGLDMECRRIAVVMEFAGPPRRLSHPMEYWGAPSVATEIAWFYTPVDVAVMLARFNRIGPAEEVVPVLFSFCLD